MMKLILILALALGGCASVPMADQAADAQAKRFAAPDGKAAIYLFRDSDFGGNWAVNVGMEGRVIGQTAAKTYFLWHVPPGRHQVTSHAENLSVVTINAEAGQIYFVEHDLGVGLNQTRASLRLVDAERGRAGVLASRRAIDLIAP